ncbi:M14 family zinc carboxypeptidase [Paenibacillus polymyxa]|uniref:M14 family zinc carboxypeptidase n=1 Tax=Paenibacillus polymyxa TaxID=1406 RepID=UPI0025B682EC|nr:M14 family metallopeptidase [Paenibacillus polymyxa]MDN4085485.1 M14 family zinc carboxypeptidase [Paenibacillus polymyxa]MDN4108753.1 M14 family zinc carboxypeptidase [Paenibacillus polymyxa]
MREYIVQKGDTLHRVASAFKLSADTLIADNPWAATQPYLICGQLLYIRPSTDRKYVIQSGENARQIAKQFDVELDELRLANSGLAEHNFVEGKIIIIPEDHRDQIVRLRGEYSYEDLMEDLKALVHRFPFIEVGSIGTSVMGKDIPYIRIGQGTRKIHANASVHANEWLTTPCLLRFIEQYARGIDGAEGRDAEQLHDEWGKPTGNPWVYGGSPQDLMEHTSLWVVPMVNPDGVELVQQGVLPTHPLYHELRKWNEGRADFRGWKANIRGVDLNDQFPAYWEEEVRRRGKTGPSRRDYAGPAPLSEPESKALADLTEREQFDMVLSIHSQGQEIYWNYRDLEPKESRDWALQLAAATGYRAVKLGGSDAGYKDWFIQRFGKPGFTVEVGLGVNPLPMRDYEDIAAEVGMLMATVLSW